MKPRLIYLIELVLLFLLLSVPTLARPPAVSAAVTYELPINRTRFF